MKKAKKMIIKALSVMLAVVITLTAAPLSGLVGLELPEWLDFSIMSSAAETSGVWDDNIVWEFNESTNTLTISGVGPLEREETWSGYIVFPWAYLDDKINKVVIDSGITTIGNSVFADYGSLTSIKIPNSVKTIGDYAFYDCYSLTNVTIPDSVTSIGCGAFKYCRSLTDIAVSRNISVINNETFWYCSKLTNVAIPDGVTTIGDSAFDYCESLVSIIIPNSVTAIGERAFYCCKSITNITIPKNISIIGNEAFRGCSSLTNITVNNDNSYYSSDENGVLFNKNKTILIQYPIGNTRDEYTIPSGVITVGSYAFYKCQQINSVIISDGVTTIGNSAFSECISLNDLTLPDSIKYIGNSAFSNCNIHSNIIIPNGVVSIGEYAFIDSRLGNNIEIPQSVTTIGCCAFSRCWLLERIMVDENNLNYSSDKYGVLFNKDKTILEQYPIGNSQTHYSIPDSVTTIGRSSFSNCSNLKSISISNNVREIYDYAFYGCNRLTDVYFSGTKAEWDMWISVVGEGNTNLLNATIHYNSTGGTTDDELEEPNEPEENKYDILGREFDKSLDYYTHYWDSSTYDTTLANMLAALSAAVYDKTDIKNAYTSLGFEDYFGVYDYKGSFDPSTCGYALSFKDSEYTDERICLVTVRGSDNVSDWIGNFTFDSRFTDEKHIGFVTPAYRIYNHIESVLMDDLTSDNVKFVITGHSRGAAVANLLSVELMENGVSASNIYNYNFACPDVACKLIFPDYTNIFNLCNREDIVPFLPGPLFSAYTEPLTSWGKFGQTYWFTKDADGTINPFKDHDSELYLEFFDQQLYPTEWNGSFMDEIDDFAYWTFGWITKILCPVDVIITDESGNQIASVINGEVNYYNSSFGDIIICTDGDQKVIYVNGDNNFNVELIGTDTGTMTYSIEKCNFTSGEISESKTFNDVILEEGKTMYSPVSEAEETEDVQLFVTEEVDGEVKYTHTIDSDGIEEIIEKATSGTCGDNLTWNFDEPTGTLTISGVGEMYTYDDSYEYPWEEFKDSIKSIAVENGVTTIADGAFSFCTSLESVTMPNSLKTLGKRVFERCSVLSTVIISNNITEIPDNAFFGCISLSNIIIPNGISVIGENAFAGCFGLESITIPKTILTIKHYAFWFCDALTDVYYGGNEESWNNVDVGYFNDLLLNANIHFEYDPTNPDEPEYDYTFSIQTPSTTTIRHKDGIKLHAIVEGAAPASSYVVWTTNNNKFKTEEINNGNSLKIVSDSNGKTTFTATLYSADGEVLATDTIEMKSKAGFFDKIGSFFRSLFGGTKIHEN